MHAISSQGIKTYYLDSVFSDNVIHKNYFWSCVGMVTNSKNEIVQLMDKNEECLRNHPQQHEQHSVMMCR